MPHIGIKGLSAGHHQEDRPEDNEASPTVVDEEIDSMNRVNGGEYLRRTNNPDNAEKCEGCEPEKHDRTEHNPDPGGAAPLEAEENNKNRDRNRQHIRLK